jgi:hypothetical protein
MKNASRFGDRLASKVAPGKGHCGIACRHSLMLPRPPSASTNSFINKKEGVPAKTGNWCHSSDRSDPALLSQPEVYPLVAKQPARSELVNRIALKDEIGDPAAAIDWNLHVTALERRLMHDEAAVANMLTDVRRAEGEMHQRAPEAQGPKTYPPHENERRGHPQFRRRPPRKCPALSR